MFKFAKLVKNFDLTKAIFFVSYLVNIFVDLEKMYGIAINK
jgi:hypothetical protein